MVEGGRREGEGGGRLRGKVSCSGGGGDSGSDSTFISESWIR